MYKTIVIQDSLMIAVKRHMNRNNPVIVTYAIRKNSSLMTCTSNRKACNDRLRLQRKLAN